MNADEAAIRDMLEPCSEATRDGREEDILANHLDELVLFDGFSPGTLPDGERFGGTVRIVFCLLKRVGMAKIAHQHVVQPVERG
ncbi:MAG: hypothetical protein QUV07_02300 [Cyanobium sp. CZS 25K]|nr:hypothetical protein [Cyanobium sp. CZS25K]